MLVNNISEKIVNKIENCLKSNNNENKYSGSIFISVKEEVIFNKSFGMSNYELDVLNTTKTKFRIGSVTKQFTAVSILQLNDRGLLKLEDTLDKYIPDFPKGEIITIHHLLTHTSGIFDYTKSEGFDEKNMKVNHSVEDLIDEFKHLPYDFEPGEKYTYSNSGYILLGYIIEQVSKSSYKEFIENNIFSKLSMNNSGYDNDIQLIKDRARGYTFDKESKKILNCDYIDMSVPYAAGGLYSTVEDLFLWNNLLFKGEIIPKNVLDNLIKSHVNTGNEIMYGYGVCINNININNKVRKKVFHGGGIPGFFSMNNYYFDEDVQLIMLSNITSDYFWEAVSEIESIVLKVLD